ncbi:hypothetical protein Tco_0109675 [Tanacetum coccineum]
MRTSSNNRNKNVDNSLRTDRRTRNDTQIGQYDNQRAEVIPLADDDTRPIYDTEPLEKVDSNITLALLDMSNNEREVDQNAEKHEDECVLLAYLIANLKLGIDENK